MARRRPARPAAWRGSRWRAARRLLHLEAVPAEGLRHPGRGVVLLEGRLRVRVDPVREVEDLVARRQDRAGQASLRLGLWRGRGGRGEGRRIGAGIDRRVRRGVS